MSTCSLHASVHTAADLIALMMYSLPNIIGISHTHLHRQISDADTLSRTPFHTHTHTPHSLLHLRLRGNRAERKLRAFTEQGLSGVMATSAEYPTLFHQPREGGGKKDGEREGGVRTD